MIIPYNRALEVFLGIYLSLPPPLLALFGWIFSLVGIWAVIHYLAEVSS